MNKVVIQYSGIPVSESELNVHLEAIPQQWRKTAKVLCFPFNDDLTMVVSYTRPEFPSEEIERILNKSMYLSGMLD